MASKAPGREVRRAAGSPDVLAGGDVRGGNVKRVASAVGEESIAVALFTKCLTSKQGRQCRPNRKSDATRHRIRSVISKTYSRLLVGYVTEDLYRTFYGDVVANIIDQASRGGGRRRLGCRSLCPRVPN